MDVSEARFWGKVDRRGEDECWPWLASLDGPGYGQIKPNGGIDPALKAHRVAFYLSVGPIPDGYDVHHRCHNRECVNPGHLEAVSRLEHAERHRKGCAVHGEAEMRRTRSGRNAGMRYCAACNREKARARRAGSA